MPLETATYVSQLDAANPAHTDGLNASDAHARLIKGALRSTFPNFTAAALSATQAAIDAAVSSVTGLAKTLFPLGTAALPGITPIGDTNTGVYSSAADNLDFATAGVRAMQIDSAQKVQMKAAASVAGALDVGGAIGATGAFTGGTGQLVPAGAIFDFAGATEPTGYLLCYGQAVSRSTYAALFAAISTNHGAGDGSTTFNLPDCRGRVAAGKDNMGGSAASRLTGAPGGVTGTTLGSAGGVETHTLTQAQLPNVTLNTTIGSGQGSHSHGIDWNSSAAGGGTDKVLASSAVTADTNTLAATLPAMTGTTPLGGSNAAHNIVQPTIIFNKIIKT